MMSGHSPRIRLDGHLSGRRVKAYFFLAAFFLAFFFAGAFLAFFFFAVIGMCNDSSNVGSGPANRIPQNANNMSGLHAILQYSPIFRADAVFYDLQKSLILLR